jgi:two-component system phosphate regulon sensor histidine kinase PhoR
MFASIRARLVIAFSLVVILSLSLTGFLFMNWIENYLEGKVKSLLGNQCELISTQIGRMLKDDEELADVAALYVKDLRLPAGSYLRIMRTDGRVVAESGERLYGALYDPKFIAASSYVTRQWYESTNRGRILHTFSEITVHNVTKGFADLSTPIPEVDETLAVMRSTILFSILASLAVSWLIVLFVSGTLTRPISEVIRVAGRIAEGDLSERVKARGRGELSRLGETLNHMAGQLETKIGEVVSERNRMNALLVSMLDGVIALDTKRAIIFLNPAAERFLRVTSRDSSNRLLSEVWPNREVEKLVEEGLRERAVLSRELQLTERLFKVFLVPFEDEKKAHRGTMLLFRDISDVRRVEEARAQFLSSISHELRTPLTIIKGFVVNALDSPALAQDEALARSLRMIDRETDRLSRLVEDLLELSRLKAKKMSLDLSPQNADDVVKETVMQLIPNARRVGIALEEILDPRQKVIIADRDRLKQIVMNIIDNALKYTPPGGRVTVRSLRENLEWRLEVEDTGAGIPPDELPYLFERFFRSKEKSKRKDVKGTGLGLAIVKELVEAHMGRIDVESTVGKGTRFTVLIPLYLI